MFTPGGHGVKLVVRVRVGVGLMVSSPQFRVLHPKIMHCLSD